MILSLLDQKSSVRRKLTRTFKPVELIEYLSHKRRHVTPILMDRMDVPRHSRCLTLDRTTIIYIVEPIKFCTNYIIGETKENSKGRLYRKFGS